MYLRASSESTMLIVSAIVFWSMLSIVCGSANFSTTGEIGGRGPPAGAVTVTAGRVAGSADGGGAGGGDACCAVADTSIAKTADTASTRCFMAGRAPPAKRGLVHMAAPRRPDLHERGRLGTGAPRVARPAER